MGNTSRKTPRIDVRQTAQKGADTGIYKNFCNLAIKVDKFENIKTKKDEGLVYKGYFVVDNINREDLDLFGECIRTENAKMYMLCNKTKDIKAFELYLVTKECL